MWMAPLNVARTLRCSRGMASRRPSVAKWNSAAWIPLQRVIAHWLNVVRCVDEVEEIGV